MSIAGSICSMITTTNTSVVLELMLPDHARHKINTADRHNPCSFQLRDARINFTSSVSRGRRPKLRVLKQFTKERRHT
jgi:hypothetical protein